MDNFIQTNNSATNGGGHAGNQGEAPQVSVIIPAFNAASTIVRALDSVLTQTGRATEIIVIDDGSADDTVAVVRRRVAGLPNVKLIEMKRNRGVSAARNAGIDAARGQFIAFLDADDVWLPGKLSKQLQKMEEDPEVALVSCNSRLISAEGVPLKEGHRNRPPVEGADAWKTLLVYNFIPTPTVLARTELIKASGGFDETLAVGEDLDLWIKLGTRGKIAILSEILINYYDVAGSLMKRHGGQAGVIVTPMIDKHIAAQSYRLSRAEIRRIRGNQSFQMGCDLFFLGSYLASVPLFLKSAFFGARPIKSLLYIPRAFMMEFFALGKRLIATPR
jgi:glycosyltransferase involved in cell wall biosynthesis